MKSYCQGCGILWNDEVSKCPNCGQPISPTVLQTVSDDKIVYTYKTNFKGVYVFSIAYGIINGLGLSSTLGGNHLGIILVWIFTILFELLLYFLFRYSSNANRVEFCEHRIKAFRVWFGIREINYSEIAGIDQKNYVFVKYPRLYGKQNNNLITLPVRINIKPQELNGMKVIDWLNMKISKSG